MSRRGRGDLAKLRLFPMVPRSASTVVVGRAIRLRWSFADESDDNPLALCTVICSKCSTLHPTDQLLTDWAERLAERRCPGDKVQWQDYVGVYLRDAADDQAEIDIAGRVYRVQRSELGPVGP
jgi:hypothetical protein